MGYIFSDKTGTLTRNVMEFKYMLVGQEFYGDLSKFEQKRSSEGENEGQAFKRMKTLKETGKYEDPNKENKSWSCDNYNKIMNADINLEINNVVKSSKGGDSLPLTTQKDQVTEFMKILGLAHMCEAESFTDKDGNVSKFYNGPSPDEVALVEFASTMNFDCTASENDFVRMKMKTKDSHEEIEFEVFKKMEFDSDRKRMSILLRDPTDGKVKLLIKGADSIIKDRLDKSQFPKEIEDRTEWFLNTASKQGLRTLLMGMRVVEESELKDFMDKVKAVELDINPDKKALLAKVYSDFEQNIVLIGGTAVEDRL